MTMSRTSADAGGDRSLLRRINSLAALRLLWRGPATVAAVAASVGVSRTAAQQIVDELVQLRWVVEQPPSEEQRRRVGPTPRYYRMRAEAGYIAGVDIAGRKVSAALADLSGRIVANSHVSMPKGAGALVKVAAVAAVVDTCLNTARKSVKDLWLVTAGTHGVIDQGHVRFIGNVHSDFNLAEELRATFDRPVMVDNDCNLAAVAEHWSGTARGIDDFVCVQVGHAVGAGIFINGSLHRGFAGYAAEINQLPSSGWKRPAHYIDDVATHGLEPGHKAVFTAAHAGDPVAQSAVDEFTRAVATGIATISAVVDPELVVLGGGVSRAGPALLEPVRRHLKDLTIRMPDLELSELGDQAVMLGAIRVGINMLDARIAELAKQDGSLPRPQRRAIQKQGWK